MNPGTWSGSSPIAYGYQWQLCDAAGTACSPVTYQDFPDNDAPTSQDIGDTLEVTVTATNAAGRASATSAPSAPVLPPPPPTELFAGISAGGSDLDASNRYSPDAFVDEQLQAGHGAAGEVDSYSFQWLQCDPDLADPYTGGPLCIPIPGATASTYTTQPGDFGYEIEVTITASNLSGSTSVSSPPTPAVYDGETVGAPTYEGPAVVGATITANQPILQAIAPVASSTTYTFTYYTPQGPVVAQQGTNGTFVIPAAATGETIELAATTTFFRSDGQPVSLPGYSSTSITQTTTTPAIQLPPTPVISGTPTAGNTYTADPGTWPGDGAVPIAYQWQDCDANGGQCTDITGATDATYATTPSDVGHTVRVVVTAGSGSSTATSPSAPSLAILAADAPQNAAAPEISGTPTALQTLTADPGTWTGDAPIAYGYQWQSCDADGANCQDIADATDSTYIPQDVRRWSLTRGRRHRHQRRWRGQRVGR